LDSLPRLAEFVPAVISLLALFVAVCFVGTVGFLLRQAARR